MDGDSRAIRTRALRRLFWVTPLALGWAALLVWLGRSGWTFHGYGIAAPAVPMIYFGAEAVTGVSVSELSQRWDELGGWARAAVGLAIALAAAVVFGGIAFLVGLSLTGDLRLR
jgi:hypothetical protein